MESSKLPSEEQASLLEECREIGKFIGQTPLFPIKTLSPQKGARIFGKLEWQQHGGSVKARPAYRIIHDAIAGGHLDRNTRLLDASSGNTAIAYAHIGAALNLPVTLCLPENASEERKQTLRALGAELKLTSRTGGTDKAREVAREMHEKHAGRYFYADQYSNDSNWKAHYHTTGKEIWQQTRQSVTHFITGLGTTGTFTGTSRRLKEYKQDISVIGLQPRHAMHGLEGWKHLETARTPSIYDRGLADELRSVSTEKAYEMLKETARREGLLLSPSSAANLYGALQLAGEIEEGVIVTVFPDNGNKYGEIMNQLF